MADLNGDVIGTTDNSIIQRINSQNITLEQLNSLGTFPTESGTQRMYVNYIDKGAGIVLPANPAGSLNQRIIGFVRTYVRNLDQSIHWSQELEVQFRNTTVVSQAETYKRAGWVTNQANADISNVAWIKQLNSNDAPGDVSDVILTTSSNNTWVVNGVDTGIAVIDKDNPPDISIAIDGTIVVNGEKTEANINWPVSIERGGTERTSRHRALDNLMSQPGTITSTVHVNSLCVSGTRRIPTVELANDWPRTAFKYPRCFARANGPGLLLTLRGCEREISGTYTGLSRLYVTQDDAFSNNVYGPQLYYTSVNDEIQTLTSYQQWNRAVTAREVFPIDVTVTDIVLGGYDVGPNTFINYFDPQDKSMVLHNESNISLLVTPTHTIVSVNIHILYDNSYGIPSAAEGNYGLTLAVLSDAYRPIVTRNSANIRRKLSFPIAAHGNYNSSNGSRLGYTAAGYFNDEFLDNIIIEFWPNSTLNWGPEVKLYGLHLDGNFTYVIPRK